LGVNGVNSKPLKGLKENSITKSTVKKYYNSL